VKRFGKRLIPLWVLIFLAGGLEAAQLSLKLSGGMSFINPGHLNRALQTWEEWQRREAADKANFTFVDGNVGRFKNATEFQAELLLEISTHLAIGIGTGYIYSDLPEEDVLVTIEKLTGTFSYTYPTKISALPLMLTATYYIPLNEIFRLYFRGAAGVAWAKYVDRDGNKNITAENFGYPRLNKGSASGPIYAGGIGLTFQVEEGVQIFAETSWRRAKLSGFEGENKDEESGTLFFYEELDEDLEYWQAKNTILPASPEGENLRSAEETMVDFSGFTARIGISIKF